MKDLNSQKYKILPREIKELNQQSYVISHAQACHASVLRYEISPNGQQIR